jgi:hypothetical protein
MSIDYKRLEYVKKLNYLENLMSIDNKIQSQDIDVIKKYKKILLDNKDILDLDLKFDFATQKSLPEFFDFIKNYMSKYNIGNLISRRFWGLLNYKKIQNILYSKTQKVLDEKEPISQFKIYDDLQKSVSNEFPNYAVSRVARTEGKNLSIILQLTRFRESGGKFVIHKTRNDEKVSSVCRLLNNREMSIDWLLSSAGEKSRIAVHPNCRCRYQLSTKGL